MTEIKVCGITNMDDAGRAVELGAWALGMVFWPQSPRRCEIEAAEEISARLRRRTGMAGVFVNASLDHVAAVADRCALSLLQLHGDEGPSYCAEAARRTGCRVIRAARVASPAEVKALEAYNVDYRLLDAYVPGQPGGTGRTFNWEFVPRGGGPPVILAGGLEPGNVRDAVEATRPFAVDTASGTEAAPGRKDPARLDAFFAAVTSADVAVGAAADGTSEGEPPARRRAAASSSSS